MMNRREFVGTLALGLLATPVAAEAQPVSRIYRIGLLDVVPATENAANLAAFRRGLAELGYVEGRNVLIEYRSAGGQAERFPDLATEMVQLKVDLIVTRGTPAALAAKRATGTIPIVMASSGDPSPPALPPAWPTLERTSRVWAPSRPKCRGSRSRYSGRSCRDWSASDFCTT